jgi:ubiquinone/menaquinone biosynthesis C-methylase UbiE
MRMPVNTRHRFVTAVVTAFVAVPILHAQSAKENAPDAERLVEALAIHAGSTVGEIGAGAGELTIALAKVVGPSGHVVSNDLNKASVTKIGKAVADASLANVAVVEGRENETNFPPGCCDAIFMRNVYHHFGDPPRMNASILESLKPGGRVAVIDFSPPPGGENPPGSRGLDNHHGVTADTLARELEDAGFEVLSSATESRAVFVVARKPSS